MQILPHEEEVIKEANDQYKDGLITKEERDQQVATIGGKMYMKVLKAKQALRDFHKLNSIDNLIYIGATEISTSKRLLQFNVNQHGHTKHGSTIAKEVRSI